jgi:hypothetical protein
MKYVGFAPMGVLEELNTGVMGLIEGLRQD